MRSRCLFGRSRLRRAALAAVVAALTAAAPAPAGTVTSTFDNVSPGEVVTIKSGSNPAESGWAGVYNFKNATGDITGRYGGFCIDIGQDMYSGLTATFTVADLAGAPVPGPSMGQARADLIRELWYNDHALIGAGNSNAAAFQLAIWEIINEDQRNADGALQLSLSGGTFTASDPGDPATIQTANTWLSQLDLHGNGPKDTSLIALTNPTYQDYVTSVPAPPGLVLGGIAVASGALAAGWRRLRRRGGRPAASA